MRSACPPDSALFDRQFQALYWTERRSFADDDAVVYFVVFVASHGPLWLLARSARRHLEINAASVASSNWIDILFVSCAFVVDRPVRYSAEPLSTPLDRLMVFRKIPLLLSPASEITPSATQKQYREMMEQMICHEDPLPADIWLIERQRVVSSSGRGTRLVMLSRPDARRMPSKGGLLRGKTIAERQEFIETVKERAWVDALTAVCVPYCALDNNSHIFPPIPDDRRSASSASCASSHYFASECAIPVAHAGHSGGQKITFRTLQTRSERYSTRVNSSIAASNSSVLWSNSGENYCSDIIFNVPEHYRADELKLATRFACLDFDGAEDSLASLTPDKLLIMFRLCEVYLRLSVWPRRMAAQCILADRAVLKYSHSELSDLLNVIPTGECPILEALAKLMNVAAPPETSDDRAPTSGELSQGLDGLRQYAPEHPSQQEKWRAHLEERLAMLCRAMEDTEDAFCTEDQVKKSDAVQNPGIRRSAWPPSPAAGTPHRRAFRHKAYSVSIDECKKDLEKLAGHQAVVEVELRALDERIKRICGHRSVNLNDSGSFSPSHNHDDAFEPTAPADPDRQYFGSMGPDGHTPQLISAATMFDNLMQRRARLAKNNPLPGQK